jgi:hypothetical protein
MVAITAQHLTTFLKPRLLASQACCFELLPSVLHRRWMSAA